MKRVVFAVTVLVGLAFGAWAASEEAAKPEAKPSGGCPMMDAAKPELKPQTLCPVTGQPINKATYVDVSGFRVYTCCAACIETIKADPAAYLAKVRARGECPECLCTVCEKCGEFKGSEACCKPGAPSCDACGLHKGAPGCCKPDRLGKLFPCGLDPKACGMKPGACGAANAPAAGTGAAKTTPAN